MLRFLLRLTGVAVLAAAFALFVADATRAIAAGAPIFTSVRAVLDWVAPSAAERLRIALETLHPLLWDPLATLLLKAPAAAPLAAVAILLLLLGARRADG